MTTKLIHIMGSRRNNKHLRT